MKDKKFNHAVSLNIEVKSDNEIPTNKEILLSCQAKLKEIEGLSEEDLEGCFEIFDTYGSDDDDSDS